MEEGLEKIIYKDLSYKITGWLFKTHQQLGRYKNEKQYGDYLEQLFKDEQLNYAREYKLIEPVLSNKIIRCKVDFLIDDKIILELKAKPFITREDYYQTKRYLNTLNLKLAILVNFRQYRLAPKRILNSNYSQHSLNNS